MYYTIVELLESINMILPAVPSFTHCVAHSLMRNESITKAGSTGKVFRAKSTACKQLHYDPSLLPETAALSHLPLPDERPRQSVANLIGRFEQQNKRQSVTPTPPRTSSVASHHTGDSVKEEIKEKREWPPKPKSEVIETSRHITESPRNTDDGKGQVQPDALMPAVESQEVPPPPPPEVAVPIAKPIPTRQSSVGSITMPTRTPGTPSKTASSRSSITTTRTPARPAAKSPPTSFHGAPSGSTSSSTPAKAPASTKSTSTSTPSRPRPLSRASITPARSKTPSLRPKTPSSAATITPTTPGRPKTPASGLFAPTAASLAKARNAAEPVPVPVRKLSSGPGVMERLSKPTAASLSKSVVPSPTRGGSPARGTTRGATVRGAHATRGTVATRGTALPKGATMKMRGAAAGAKIKAAPGAPVVAQSSDLGGEQQGAIEEHHDHVEEPEILASPIEHDQATHELESSESTLIDEPQHALIGLTDEPTVHVAAEETAEVILNAKEEDLEAEAAQLVEPEEFHEEAAAKELAEAHHEDKQEPAEVEILAEAREESHVEPEETEAVPAPEEHVEPESHQLAPEPDAAHVEESAQPEVEVPDAILHVDGASTPTPIGGKGTDLEDLIHMLEAQPRPVSVVSIPDEVMDIPDED
ncbi:uncharacterized protein FIBRA_01313 [Fibroporia radiculosa]|uniref:Uncharacterized protein n=1 Tax=Fibroporia radiculosa TaxID=599839 RepID=J4HT41_9APHY|nr:uncharacterized protein FIBRA_01313 [Fibroporia radiculosa]CCL99297.1 predicted protein [Fibroporia radiculosa]